MKKSISIREITNLSIYVAIIIFLSFTPQTGYITIGTISITIIPIVITLATFHLGFKGALASSLSFGIFSYIVSITIVPSPLADPVLLIVPRFLLGIIIWSIWKYLGENKLWKFVLLASLTVFFNTVLITGFLFVVNSYNELIRVSIETWIVLIYINFFVELTVAIILSLPLYKLVDYLRSKNFEQNKW